jgi:hypothetical protein
LSSAVVDAKVLGAMAAVGFDPFESAGLYWKALECSKVRGTINSINSDLAVDLFYQR